LDLESVDRYFDGLLEAITDDDERDAGIPALHQDAARTAVELFAAKEALYKALFPTVGRFFGFESARARPVASGGAVELELVEDLHEVHTAGSVYRVDLRWQDRSVMASLAIPAGR
jgi:enterobactin synthetase component D